MEIKELEGFDLKYAVSEDGGIHRILSNGGFKKLAVRLNRLGYERVNLVRNGKRPDVYVHRLLAKAFIPNPENKREVNHKNGIRHDNRLENLEWVTASENIRHRYRNRVKRKFTMLDLDVMYEQTKTMTLKQVAETYNIDAPTLHKLLSYIHPLY